MINCLRLSGDEPIFVKTFSYTFRWYFGDSDKATEIMIIFGQLVTLFSFLCVNQEGLHCDIQLSFETFS